MLDHYLPAVRSVREVVVGYDGLSFVLIAPDPTAGCPSRYSVIRVRQSGRATCIGRELPLALARAVAARPAREDGRPFP